MHVLPKNTVVLFLNSLSHAIRFTFIYGIAWKSNRQNPVMVNDQTNYTTPMQ